MKSLKVNFDGRQVSFRFSLRPDACLIPRLLCELIQPNPINRIALTCDSKNFMFCNSIIFYLV
jgi:hypothetical protein